MARERTTLMTEKSRFIYQTLYECMYVGTYVLTSSQNRSIHEWALLGVKSPT